MGFKLHILQILHAIKITQCIFREKSSIWYIWIIHGLDITSIDIPLHIPSLLEHQFHGAFVYVGFKITSRAISGHQRGPLLPFLQAAKLFISNQRNQEI